MEQLTTDQKFGAIIQSLTKIESSIEELKAGQDRHEELLTQLVASQEKQDHIIENQSDILATLSEIAIKHETEFRKLKNKKAI
jgi:hypothetical protein